jgi:hypothetical protein
VTLVEATIIISQLVLIEDRMLKKDKINWNIGNQKQLVQKHKKNQQRKIKILNRMLNEKNKLRITFKEIMIKF